MTNAKNVVRLAAFLAVGIVGGWGGAQAQSRAVGYVLPMDVALEGALEAVQTCNANGYAVTASVVDVSGNQQVVLRGDRATVHTKDTAYRKAYTVITMGPIFQFDRTSRFVELLAKYPPIAAQSLATTPNVTALAGGVAIKVGDEIVGGIGIGGSPGGDKDEVCAQAGVVKIQKRLAAVVTR